MTDTNFSDTRLRSDLQTLVSFGPHARGDVSALNQTIEFVRESLAEYDYVAEVHRFGDGPSNCNILAERASAEPDRQR